MSQKNRMGSFLIVLLFIFFPIFTSGQIDKNDTASKEQQKLSNAVSRVPEYNIRHSSENELVVEFFFPQFTSENKIIHKKKYDVITVPGCSQCMEAGKPQLPQKSFLFAIPPGKRAEMEILADETSIREGFNIYPAPKIIEQRNEKNFEKNFVEQTISTDFCVDNSFYRKNIFYPARMAKIEIAGQLRHHPIGKIQVFPFQFNPSSGHMRHHKKITIKIGFLTDESARTTGQKLFIHPTDFDSALKNNLINYETAKHWRTARASTNSTGTSKKAAHISEGYKICVKRDGIYFIDRQQFEQAGFNVTDRDPKYIKIFFKGSEIPIFIYGQEDGIFDETDYIEFYGRKSRNDYTHTNVYWLTWDDSTPGKRMTFKDGTTTGAPRLTSSRQTVHFETETYYFTAMPNGEGKDHWFWDYFIAPKSSDLTFDIQHVADTSAEDCSFEIEFFGYSDDELYPDHHTIVSLNGTQLMDDTWDGAISFNNRAVLPQSLLINGTNTITLNLPGDTGASSDIIYLNFYEITFWQNLIAQNDSLLIQGVQEGLHGLEVKGFASDEILVYDVTDYSDIKKITNIAVKNDSSGYCAIFEDSLVQSQQFLAITAGKRIVPEIIRDEPSQLASSNHQADYIIITHEDFYSALQPLKNYRQSTGLNTSIVKITDIYDEFNYGIKDPRAIKYFLSHTFCHWQAPAPAYVLLVGDASYDPKDFQGTGHPDLVPTHLFESRHYNTETASDNWFACVAGDDNLPDMYIGRLSAQSVEQAELLVSRIIDYETTPVESDWNKNVLFFADDDDETEHFEAYTDTIISHIVPQDFNVETVYLNDYTDNNLARSDLMNKFNQGCLIANYFGHGSLIYLAGEKLLKNSDVTNMTNLNQQPFFLSLSCINGFFHHAQLTDCLAEALVKGESGGTIGCLAPSGFAISSVMGFLAEEMYDGLFDKRDATLGALSLRAKLGILKGTNYYLDHIDFYNLFGDPALRLKIDSLSHDVYARYSGELFIRDMPAPVGTQLNAWVEGMERPVNFRVMTEGWYGPIAIISDEASTPQIEGGTEGDSLQFEVITTSGDTIPVEPVVKWNIGEHLINLVAQEKIITTVDEITYQISVADRRYGLDFFDGDPLFKNSRIEIGILQNEFDLDMENTRFILNDEPTGSGSFGFARVSEGSDLKQKIIFPLENLSDGRYALQMEVQNPAVSSFGTVFEISFRLTSSMILEQVFNFPNPMTDQTTFTYLLMNENPADVNIKIYTVAGRLIRKIDLAPGEIGHNRIVWNGHDQNNDAIANGIYFYKITAKTWDTCIEKIEKLVVMK